MVLGLPVSRRGRLPHPGEETTRVAEQSRGAKTKRLPKSWLRRRHRWGKRRLGRDRQATGAGSLYAGRARLGADAPFLREYGGTDHVRKHAARRNSARLYEGTQARSQLITKTHADVTSTSARGPPPLGDVDGLPRPQGTRAQQAQSGPGDQRLGAVSCSCLLLAEAPGSTNAGPEVRFLLWPLGAALLLPLQACSALSVHLDSGSDSKATLGLQEPMERNPNFDGF
nr:PREDICTED: uncharacterized protein LOC103544406 isoform X2 [Equus przewalskii]